MNCKQGDLAIHMGGYLGTKSPNLGKVLTCIRLATDDEKTANRIKKHRVIWITDTLIEWKFSEPIHLANDKSLRPLRGDLSNDDADLFVSSSAPKVEALNHEQRTVIGGMA